MKGRPNITSTEEGIDVNTALADIRGDLIVAIAADQRRSRRRRRTATIALAFAATLIAVGASVAATSGVFSPAPDRVKDTFGRLDSATGVDESKAIEIGTIDDHVAYAAPTADGGFCLHFADNPRSGPSGSTCVPHGAQPGEIAFNVSLGTDGGFAFGRVGNEDATTVAIKVPHSGGTVTTPVAEERFFLAELPARAIRALTITVQPGPKDPPTKDGGPIRSFDSTRIAAITATAQNAHGTTVARGANAALPDPGVPTETTTTPAG
jgi:hypothetical protein